MNNQLVFVKDQSLNAEPFTTGDIIAKYADIERESVNRTIRNKKSRLEHFGKVGYYIQPLSSGQKAKVFLLNEQQATLLVTFLKNTEKVADFKEELVRQFFLMKKELQERQIRREAGKLTTSAMNNAIKARKDLDGHAYINFEQLAYKAALGKNATQIKRERGVPKSTPSTEYLTAVELNKVSLMKQKIAVLLELGMEYQAIKALITGAGIKALMVNKTLHKAREGGLVYGKTKNVFY